MLSQLIKIFSSSWEIHPVDKIRFPIYCSSCNTELTDPEEREFTHRRLRSIYLCPTCGEKIVLRITPRNIYLKNGTWEKVY